MSEEINPLVPVSQAPANGQVPVPYRTHDLDGVIVRNPCDPLAARRGHWTTIDESTQAGRDMVDLCLEGEDEKGEQVVNLERLWSHVYCHEVEMEAEDGQLIPAKRIVIISPDGHRIAWVAKSIFEAVGLIAYRHGDPPWSPALRVVVRIKKTAGKGIWYLAKVVGREGVQT